MGNVALVVMALLDVILFVSATLYVYVSYTNVAVFSELNN